MGGKFYATGIEVENRVLSVAPGSVGAPPLAPNGSVSMSGRTTFVDERLRQPFEPTDVVNLNTVSI